MEEAGGERGEVKERGGGGLRGEWRRGRLVHVCGGCHGWLVGGDGECTRLGELKVLCLARHRLELRERGGERGLQRRLLLLRRRGRLQGGGVLAARPGMHVRRDLVQLGAVRVRSG